METELKLADDLIPAMIAGTKCVTIRKGRREFAQQVTIAGHACQVESVEHYTMSTCPLHILKEDGFTSRRDAIDQMKRFYPDLDKSTDITVVHFRLKGKYDQKEI
jgi:hypothetical protein